MGTDEPGFDRAEQGVDDREKRGSLGALILDDGRVFEMLIERRLLSLITGKTIGHEVRFGSDIVFEEATQFGGAGLGLRRLENVLESLFNFNELRVHAFRRVSRRETVILGVS